MSIFSKRKMNILVLGADGMLGHDVYEHVKCLSSAKNSGIGIVTGITLADGIDVTKRHALSGFMLDKIHYDWCINCIAYTDTWKAEYDQQGKADSYKLNVLAPKFIAESCNLHKTKLIHISTDYVFSEYDSKIHKFSPDDYAFPKNNYGIHKLLGEKEIAESFRSEKDYAILRVAWLYGAHNKKSFIHKLMKNVGKACKEATDKTYVKVNVTSNEFSIPTSTRYVVFCISEVIENKMHGILHAVPSVPAGEHSPSRIDFAKEILMSYDNEKTLFGCKLSSIKLNGVPLADNALYPSYSVMKTSFDSISWKYLLTIFMLDYKQDILEYARKENEK